MTFFLADFVAETAYVAGIGQPIALRGAAPGAFKTFLAGGITDGQQSRLVVVDPISGVREVRVYTYVASTNTFTAGALVESTAAANAAINFAGNLCTVFCGVPAGMMVTADNFVAQLAAAMLSLPTSLPGAANQPWLDGRVLVLS